MSQHNDVSWSTAFKAVLAYIDRHAYVEGRDRLISALYTIAQVFYDLVPVFPILRIIGEWGSGEWLLAWLLANAIASASPLHTVVVDPCEAKVLLNDGYERSKSLDLFKLLFSLYSPKIIVSRPGRLDLPPDTISRIIEVYVERFNEKAYPLEATQEEREEVASILILLKYRHEVEFLDAYNMLRGLLIKVEPRTRDTYLPLITVAYLISRESNDPGLFKAIIEDMLRAVEEEARVDSIQVRAIAGILKHIIKDNKLTGGGVVKVVKVSVKDIADVMGIGDRGLRTEMGKFLSKAPFKVGVERSGGRTYYVIDVNRLYGYVKRHNLNKTSSWLLDLSHLLDAGEFEELRRRTGLDWTTGVFNKDEFIGELLGRLFPCNNAASSGVETAVEI